MSDEFPAVPLSRLSALGAKNVSLLPDGQAPGRWVIRYECWGVARGLNHDNRAELIEVAADKVAWHLNKCRNHAAGCTGNVPRKAGGLFAYYKCDSCGHKWRSLNNVPNGIRA